MNSPLPADEGAALPFKWTRYVPGKSKPASYGWYLVALPKSKNTIATVSLCWWDSGWSAPWNYDNGEKMPRPKYFSPVPTMPKWLEVQRQQEFRKARRKKKA